MSGTVLRRREEHETNGGCKTQFFGGTSLVGQAGGGVPPKIPERYRTSIKQLLPKYHVE